MSLVPAVVANPPQPLPVERPGFLARLVRWAMPSPKSSPASLPLFPTGGVAIIGQQTGLVWKSNALTYREWSLTPWVRAAIKIRREQIASADWDIVPYEKDGRQNKRLAKRIRDLLDTPNARNISFHAFAQEVMEDLLVLDGAAIEKVRYPGGELAELWNVPAEYIAIDPRWDGTDEGMARYYYIPDGQVRAKFTNADMLYLMDNPRTNSVVGISPIEVLRNVIDAESRAMAYNRRMVNGAPPEGVLNIGDSAQPSDVDTFESKWNARVAGQQGMAVIGGFKNPSFIGFRPSNRDMQYREWIDLLIRCIAVVYGLSPMDLGITFDVNRSTAETQQENTTDRGLRPLLDLYQRYITREIVWDEAYGGRENNLAFAFGSISLNESTAKATINKVALGGTAWKTINEARVMDGRPAIGDMDDEDNIFNHILLMTPQGLLDITTQEYVGAEQMAQLASTDAATTGKVADENAAAAKDGAEPPAKKGPGVPQTSKGATEP